MRSPGKLTTPGSLKNISVLRLGLMDGFQRAESSRTLHGVFIVHICRACLLQLKIDG